MQVVARLDANFEELQWALAEFGQMAAQSETLVIALAGRFVHSSTETYFLPVDAQSGPLATLPARSLPLSTVMAWLAAKPGDAVLVLATERGATAPGPFLADGVGTIDVPQGVTLMVGNSRAAIRFLTDVLPRPGRPFVGAAQQSGLAVSGYTSRTNILLDAPAAAPTCPSW